ncbi:hypothetical protein AVEN_85272-1 [Araneus ventricosus]|uniref:Uncharacterized protein n=1 Tax=Araneus ventricosus TaxID=182803 RepID=A0A4Y2K276_ARAVE|nr:hypothetical protein AVEN_85272-1 [Araneus ventricosus]
MGGGHRNNKGGQEINLMPEVLKELRTPKIEVAKEMGYFVPRILILLKDWDRALISRLCGDFDPIGILDYRGYVRISYHFSGNPLPRLHYALAAAHTRFFIFFNSTDLNLSGCVLS